MTAEPFTCRFDWTREVWGEVAVQPPPPHFQPYGTRASRAKIALPAVLLLSGPPLVMLALQVFDLRATVAWLMGAVAALALYRLVLLPFYRDRRVEAELAVLMPRGPVTVTLGPEGVETESRVARASYRWPAVAHVSATRRAITIWITVGSILPLPFEALPAGLDGTEARRRIDLWRREAANG